MTTTRHGSATVTLPSDTEILISRSFEAPQSLVWEALTTPEHVVNWYGPRWCPLISAEIDLEPGGSWRYVARDQHGNELAWSGVYQEIEPTSRIVSTEIFEPIPNAESVNTVTLQTDGGLTTLQTLVRHQNRANRDGHLQSGMEAGMQETYDRLEELLGSLIDSKA